MTIFRADRSMQSFSKRLKIDLRFVTFYFNFFPSGEDAFYFVSVVDADRIFHYFQMIKQEAAWILVTPLLSAFWIRKSEKQLSDTIIHHVLVNGKGKRQVVVQLKKSL
jgi:hypothetical protein